LRDVVHQLIELWQLDAVAASSNWALPLDDVGPPPGAPVAAPSVAAPPLQAGSEPIASHRRTVVETPRQGPTAVGPKQPRPPARTVLETPRRGRTRWLAGGAGLLALVSLPLGLLCFGGQADSEPPPEPLAKTMEVLPPKGPPLLAGDKDAVKPIEKAPKKDPLPPDDDKDAAVKPIKEAPKEGPLSSNDGKAEALAQQMTAQQIQEQARALAEHLYDYRAAALLLESVPPQLRDAAFYVKVLALREKVAELEEALQGGLQAKRPADVRKQVAALVKLQPHRATELQLLVDNLLREEELAPERPRPGCESGPGQETNCSGPAAGIAEAHRERDRSETGANPQREIHHGLAADGRRPLGRRNGAPSRDPTAFLPGQV
jgi:hypothetical protein